MRAPRAAASLLLAGITLAGAPTGGALASETDNFTRRPTTPAELGDDSARALLNDKTNEILDAVPGSVAGCDLEALHFAIKDSLGGAQIGYLEKWAAENPAVKKVVVPLAESIYEGTGFSTFSWGIALAGIDPSILVGGHYFGTDKLGHFFDQGYAYYEEIYLRHKDEMSVLENFGLEDEEGGDGLTGTGVLAYGDMATNFQGFLFWRDVAQGNNPYYVCAGDHYARTSRKFDWAEYANDAWDEAINCSEFTDWVEDKVLSHLPSGACPVKPSACQAILDLPCGFTYLSPLCYPYVRVSRLPDAACEKIIAEDAANQTCSTYEPGFWRRPMPLFVADNAKVVLKPVGSAIQRAYQAARGIAKRHLGRLMFPVSPLF